MKKIPLTQGKFALVDDEDFQFLSQWKWAVQRDSKTKGLFYAFRNRMRSEGSACRIFMHRFLVEAPKEKVVDHIDGNGLNNQRKNLRLVSAAENSFNRMHLNSNNRSGFRGISWNSRYKKWRAQITENKVVHHFGYFVLKSEAKKILDNWLDSRNPNFRMNS